MGSRKIKVSFELQVFDALEELCVADRELMAAAVSARNNAYAPYSQFYVGAAILLENGKVVIGNNQENASYPAGLCAERVAVFQAGAQYPGVSIVSIAISATSKNHVVNRPAAPCGNCRQAISEYEQRQEVPIKLLLMGEEGEIVVCNSLADILPLAFDRSFLE